MAWDSSESFRDLLLRFRGRSGLTQRELADGVGIHRRSLQEWENGASYPSAERLESLLRVLLEAGGLRAGQEAAEAQALWAAVQHAAPHTHAPFDTVWFARLLAGCSAPAGGVGEQRVAVPVAAERTTVERRQDWGEAPDTTGFVGRTNELRRLRSWVLDERCRLVAILGMGGMGKTTITARLTQEVAPSFERVYWRSLRDAPAPGEWLGGGIGFLSDHEVVPPATEAERLTALLQLLRERRCLIVLDNVETLFEPGQREGQYRAGMGGYGRLLQVVCEANHQSCVLLTSREAPPELATFSGETGSIRTLGLGGLGLTEGRALLGDRELWGDDTAWADLVATYAGNSLALKVAGGTIRDVFGGDIAAYIAYIRETYGTAVRSIRRVMEGQVERRLSPGELDVLRRLAVEREPVTLVHLLVALGPRVGRGAVLESVEALRRRSLLERAETPGTAAFTLQSVVLEYVTDRLVEAVANEIERGKPVLLTEQPLIQAHARDYVREAQERLIGLPVLQVLEAQHAEAAIAQRLVALLDGWRDRSAAEQGYGPGNVINLLRLLRGDLRGLDLSRLKIRQAYLARVDARDASLARADLTETVVAEAFDFAGSVSLSGDGAFLAAGTSTGQVCLWRVADRTPLWAAQGHTGLVKGVALSADGHQLASGGEDGMVRLWETSSGRPRLTLQALSGMVSAVALSADGEVLASSGFDGTVRVWAASTGRPLADAQGHTGAGYGVALSADGELLASGAFDGTVRIWETRARAPLTTLQGHSGPVWGVALSADGHLVATGGEDGTIRLWEPGTEREAAILQRHTGPVHSVALSADGQLLASGGADGTVRLWDTRTGQLMSTLLGHAGPVHGVTLTPDAQLLASSSLDGTVRLWEATTGRPLSTVQGNTSAVYGVALSADGQLLASGGADARVRVWATSTGELVSTLQGHVSAVRGVALAADGRLLASGSWDNTVRLWDTEPGQPLATLSDGGRGAVSLSADGRLLANRGAEIGTLQVWDTRSARVLGTWQAHPSAVWSLALSANGQFLASGGADGTLRVWDVPSGRPLAVWDVSPNGVSGVAVSADGQLLACTNDDGTLLLWAMGNAQPAAILHGHTSGTFSVALSSDGHLLASGDAEGTVRVWDTKTRAALARLGGHTAAVWSVALSAAGHLVASASWDGSVRLWETRSGKALHTLRPDRRYERLDVTGLTGVTAGQRAAMLALGAVEQDAPVGWPTATTPVESGQ